MTHDHKEAGASHKRGVWSITIVAHFAVHMHAHHVAGIISAMVHTKEGRLLLTLCIVCTGEHVLLGMKKRGFGAGKWNGFGGKVHEGEDPLAGATRELQEEAGIIPLDLTESDVLHFDFLDGSSAPGELLEVHLFTATQFHGTPTESEEMLPKWFGVAEIPYADMWPDDEYWLPKVVCGARVQCHFSFGAQDTIVDQKVTLL